VAVAALVDVVATVCVAVGVGVTVGVGVIVGVGGAVNCKMNKPPCQSATYTWSPSTATSTAAPGVL